MVTVGGKMKLLNKDTDCAIRALLHLALSDGGFVPANAIAEAQGIPAYYLKRILSKLIKGKLLAAKEGVSGGVKLLLKPQEIRVENVINLLQGEIQLSECLFRGKACPNRPTCVLRSRIRKIDKIVSNEFNKITLKTLLDDLKG
jgi:Rrf2 family cysteine metabolism transcriptional repressor